MCGTQIRRKPRQRSEKGEKGGQWCAAWATETGKNGTREPERREHIEIMSSGGVGFPHSSVGKESACSAGDTAWIPGSGRSAGEGIGYPLQYSWASLVARLVNNPPAMWETWVQSLGWKDPLQKGMATHSSILAWRISWTIQSMGSQRVGHDSVTFAHSLAFLRWCWAVGNQLVMREWRGRRNQYYFKAWEREVLRALNTSWGPCIPKL